MNGTEGVTFLLTNNDVCQAEAPQNLNQIQQHVIVVSFYQLIFARVRKVQSPERRSKHCS